MPQPLAPLERRRADNIFFTTTAVLMLLIVVVGFAPSYFLKGAVFARLPSLLVHLHGAVFSAWIVLFVVQSSLISAGNYRLHRKLGVVGGVLAVLMVVLGTLVPFGTLRRGAVLPSFFTPASFLIGNVVGIWLTGALIGVAIWQRRNSRVHKRLMFVANITLMGPALSRMLLFMPVAGRHPFVVMVVIPGALLVGLLGLDLYTWRRPLLATLIGFVVYFGFDAVLDPVIKMHWAQQLTLWAQHHP
jgi:MFS family permease